MRRFFLILTVLSIAAWSQQPSQQPQEPQKAQEQTQPPTNLPSPLIHLLELIVPGIIGTGLGAGLAFYGVSRTNKQNARENAANRQHQLDVETAKAKIAAEYRSQEKRWEMRKDVYMRLITTTTELLGHIKGVALLQDESRRLSQDEYPDEAKMEWTIEQQNSHIDRVLSLKAEFDILSSQAPLATADILPLISAMSDQTAQAANPASEEVQEALIKLLDALRIAGHKDLWGDSEPKAKAVAATENK